jgi:hypothetical protein
MTWMDVTQFIYVWGLSFNSFCFLGSPTDKKPSGFKFGDDAGHSIGKKKHVLLHRYITRRNVPCIYGIFL